MKIVLRLLSLCCICLGSLFIVYLGAQEETNPSLSSIGPLEAEHFQVLVQGNNRFAFDFYQILRHQTGNFCFSPYSLISGLAMPAFGARGETAQQCQRAFRYPLSLLPLFRDLNEFLQKSPSDLKNNSQIWLADDLWLQKDLPILPAFKQAMLRSFNDHLDFMDFANNKSQTIQLINQSISQRTQKKINNLLTPQDITGNTRLLLTTAMAMKGQWAQPFNRRQTTRQPFYITPQRTLLSDMMQGNLSCLCWNGDRWDLLILPYHRSDQEGIQLAMAFLLPKETISLEEFEKNLTWENWQQGLKLAQMRSVVIALPRFRIEKRLDATHFLQVLGITTLFNAEANLSGITKEKGLFIHRVIHKTLIKVDEQGTEVPVLVTADQKPGVEIPSENSTSFIANRPFLFIIWEQKTNSILLMGRLSFP